MIIATIGNTHLSLETLKDAETLLEIASRAKVIESSYDTVYRNYHYIDDSEVTLGIEIKGSDKLFTREEHLSLVEKRKKAHAETEATRNTAVES